MIPVTRVKEVVAMRIGAIFMLTAFLLTGCVHMKNNQNVNMLERIQKGDSQEAVLEIMGPPDLRKDIGDNRTICLLSDPGRDIQQGGGDHQHVHPHCL